MEDRQGKRSSKASILKGLNVTVSPINIQMDNHLVIGATRNYLQESNCRTPTHLDPYNEKLDLSPPMVRYFRSRSPAIGKFPSVGDAFSSSVTDVVNANYRSAISFGSREGNSSLLPLSAVENFETPPSRSPQMYGAPVKVDEEVIVMDGILVNSVSGGVKMKSVSDSGSGGFSSGKCLYKKDICRTWEDSGFCRYGHNCQFAHGKEEIRSVRLPVKSKSKICESYSTYATKFRNSHEFTGVTVTASEAINKTDLITRREDQMPLTMRTTSTAAIHDMNNKPTAISTISIKDWSPEDDGIKVILHDSLNGETSKREDVNRHIHDVLYGSAKVTKKRLPVFAQLCLEN